MNEFNTLGRQSGLLKGGDAHSALLSFSNVSMDFKHMRPSPTNTGKINTYKNKYIYTKKGGWIDMAHFIFYAGRAYKYKMEGEESPVGSALVDGLKQELSDVIVANHSAFSYEDLTSDKIGATFGAEIFNPDSQLSLGEQIYYYLLSLGAVNPEEAPNYNNMPQEESKNKPTATNKSSHPMYVTQ